VKKNTKSALQPHQHHFESHHHYQCKGPSPNTKQGTSNASKKLNSNEEKKVGTFYKIVISHKVY